MMRPSYSTAVFVVLGVLLLVPVALAQQEKDKETPHGDVAVVGVSIHDNYLEPADIDLSPGTTVRWVNRGQNPHSISADNKLFDSGPLEPGETYWVTFNGQGKVTYHSSPGMTGSITVGEGGDEDATAAEEAPANANGVDGVGIRGADGRAGADGVSIRGTDGTNGGDGGYAIGGDGGDGGAGGNGGNGGDAIGGDGGDSSS